VSEARNSYRARRATRADLPVILDLRLAFDRELLGGDLPSDRVGPHRSQVADYLATHVDGDVYRSWVVEDGQRKPQWQVSPQLLYGQLHKIKVGRRLRDMYTVVLCGTRTQLCQALNALHLSGQITTAYIERFNLTLREHIAPLARRTLALAQDEYLLGLHLAWFRAYYHFVLYHESLRIPGQSPARYRSRTPAMAAGLARRRWPVKELLLTPNPPA